ncbi:long-chain fatty acid--CoA ligase [Nocardioides sp. J2M5]|uniref:long-chain-fatty-acid--CoA ligase n=1 Tax=Nocardioides TaxID=1839 RepID=UPI001BA9E36A|nr:MULTISPECIES: long-chain fatty acid--CoA ligase [Nocardioides]MBS2937965.1 long-chain fatty acid--CoA ligase [Nocardioides palaemonis]
MTNLASILTASAARHGRRAAVRLDATALSHAELDDLSARAAGLLRARGVGPGDRVGLMLHNVLEFPVLYYAVLRAGAVVVPMNPLLKAPEVEHQLRDSGARLVLVSPHAAPEARLAAAAVGTEVVEADDDLLRTVRALVPEPGPVARSDDDTAVILYTSGTTGTPKGAQLTHANLRLNALGFGGLVELTEHDVVMGCLPLFHAFGQSNVLNASIAVGASVSLVPRFDAGAVLELVAQDRATVFAGVPTMYVTMLEAGAAASDTSSLRVCVSGGASLPLEVLCGVEQDLGTPVLEGYGLSETSPTATFNRPGRSRVGSIGVPLDGVELKLVDRHGVEVGPGEVGEIAIRGHNVMKGYWDRPGATAAAIVDGWFYSGDLARCDEDGFYYVVDRKKDLVIRGGFNIYPREIEEVLYAHPAVLEAAVIGVPHPTLGEEVAAAVTLRPGRHATAEELREHVRARVAAYKYARHVWVVDALPKGPTGKILKREIDVPQAVTALAG